MDVISSIENIPDRPSALVTMGTFDGFHLGHQKVVNHLVEKAKSLGLKSILVTYAPHPREVISEMNRNPITFISTLEERIKLLSESGLDYIVVHPFTKALASVEPDIFIRNTIMKFIDVKGFIIGYSHSFGKMRKGTPQFLKELGESELDFFTEIIKEVRNEDFTINSTNIRRLIGAGDMETVTHYLGRPYHLKGKVINGEKRGKELGFPTLNILPSSPKKIIPHVGVYCVNVYIQRRNYRGMCNVGYRPTFDGHYLTIEVHVLDAELKKLYEHEIDVDFIRRIRDEIRFNSKEELIQQLEKDKVNCKKM
jgi:riboflavin kinase / FMN adenylyltransferase